MSSLIFILLFQFTSIHSLQQGSIDDFVYYNFGTTTSQQSYTLVGITNIYNEGYQYKDNPIGSNNWNVGQPLTYLFEQYLNQTIGTPSNGLRSSVPLGPIGQGVFEIRGDGRMTDFTLFNNGPNAEPSDFGHKFDLVDSLFGFTFNKIGSQSVSKILQTSPNDENMGLYAIDSLSYSGSYPVSKLTGIDNELKSIGINSINLTAFSSFEAHNTNMSSIPGVVFWFDIDNRNNPNDVDMNVFYNLPDIVNFTDFGMNSNGFTLDKAFDSTDSYYFNSGNVSFRIQSCDKTSNQCNTPINVESYFAETVYDNWETFRNSYTTPKKNLGGPYLPKIYTHYAFSTDNITIAANSVYSFSIVFSWYFPRRTYNNNRQYLGNYYNNLYSSSDDVNSNILTNLPLIISNIISWHKLFSSSMYPMYPNYLRDIFINAPSFISRTGYYLENDVNNTGIWRQLESFSCQQVDPPHLHGYRALSYNLIFGNTLDRGTLNMYTYAQIKNGLVSENFGGGCFGIGSEMGIPDGDPRGDDNSLYVLSMYSQFKWYKDGIQYIKPKYKYVKSAMNWMINQSIPAGYGLPYRLVNTNDEHGVIGDVNTYNSMIYISALISMKIMAQYYESLNITYIAQLDIALDYAYGNLTTLLWEANDGEGFFRSFWCENGNYPQYGLQSDVLYGYLWSLNLGLTSYWRIDEIDIISHIKQEKMRNMSPYGLVFMTNRTTTHFDCSSNTFTGFTDRDTWEASSFDSSSESIYLNVEDVNDSLFLSKLIADKYRDLYADQWDFRDLSSTYNDSDPTYSRPVCNSHYTRQLIHYSLIPALNGQQLNVDSNTNSVSLNIQPKISLNTSINNYDCIPILIPQSSFLLCLNNTKNCYEAEGLFGEIEIDLLSITNNEKQNYFTNIIIQKGMVTDLCV